MSERTEDVTGGASSEAVNTVEPDVQRVQEMPRDGTVGEVGEPTPTTLDWADQDALETVKLRRQRDMAAARNGMAPPDWVPQDERPNASSLDANVQPDVAASRADATSATPTAPDAGQPVKAPSQAKDGFTTEPLGTPPDGVAKRFLQAGNRYFLRDGSQQVAFEDRGARLVTAHNRPDVAESMAEMALAKGWANIRVKGHEDFRREVWLQAAVRAIGVTGYAPTEADRARLNELMAERMTNRVEQAEPGKAGKAPAAQVPAEPSATQRAEAGLTGVLVKHGAAPYQHQKNGSRSYFVTFRDAAGAEKTVWGVDLERALRASCAQPGEQITLANLGRKPVTVDEPVLDGEGKVVGTRPKDTERNAWEIKVASREQESLSRDGPFQSPQRAADRDARLQSPPAADPKTAGQQPVRSNVSDGVVPLNGGDRTSVAPVREASLPVPVDFAGLSPESEFRGELVTHGRAPYQNRPNAQITYFATVRDGNDRNVTVWGADLERAIVASGVQPGDQVNLANYGRHRVKVDVPAVNGRGEVTGTERREVERYVWKTTVEAREPRPAAAPLVSEDPQRALQMAVIAEAMRAQGFSEKSVAKVQAKAGTVLDRLGAQGVVVPAPRVFDPKGRAQQPRSRGDSNAPSPTREVERPLQPSAPGLPAR